MIPWLLGSARAWADDPVPANVRWTAAPDGVFELVADVDSQLTFEVRTEASLAGLTTSWTQGPIAAPTGSLAVRLVPPPEAFLHELAADYLTVLRVRLVASNGATVRAPPAMLAWPDGPTGAAVVWDKPTALVEAPNGVVSDAVRATLVDRGDAWVQPSIPADPVTKE